jgi:hypothetical protein
LALLTVDSTGSLVIQFGYMTELADDAAIAQLARDLSRIAGWPTLRTADFGGYCPNVPGAALMKDEAWNAFERAVLTFKASLPPTPTSDV